MKTALIFGVTGQDGSYLSELLLDLDYEVVGVTRRVSVDTTERLRKAKTSSRFEVVEGDITDSGSVYGLIAHYKPDECYNLAAQSHVATSFEQPLLTFNVNTNGVINILEGIRRYSPNTRFYQASTSEMFGNNFTEKRVSRSPGHTECLQNERTPFAPTSPYAASKVASHNLVSTYREAYGLHASCGILFNHESERRGENFVTRKITKWIGDFLYYKNKHNLFIEEANTEHKDYIGWGFYSYPKLRLGNVSSYRDWGHAEDYVRAMHLMLQQDVPDDYVIATGESHSVNEFLKEAFAYVSIENYESFYVVDRKFYRPSEVHFLRGCPEKAMQKLGWKPRISFTNLVSRMVQGDIHAAKTKVPSEENVLP
jgi:GDPmannose 4,6-dehydratase